MAAAPAYSSSRYAEGYVDPGAVAPLFPAFREVESGGSVGGGDVWVPSYVKKPNTDRYAITSFASGDLELDNQYAIYRSGRVERVFQVRKLADIFGGPGADPAYGSAEYQVPVRTMSTGELARLGIDGKKIDARAAYVDQNGYRVQNIRRPNPEVRGWEGGLSDTLVGAALQWVMAQIVPGGGVTVAGAQLATQDRIGGHEKVHVLEERKRLNAGFYRPPPQPARPSSRTSSRYTQGEDAARSGGTWLERHANDTPFLRWLADNTLRKG